MTSAADQPPGPPSILTPFLLLTGLGCFAAIGWLGRIDVPRLVERQVTAARGAISPETSQWLQSSPWQGPLLWTGMALLAAAGILHFQRKLFRRVITGDFAPDAQASSVAQDRPGRSPAPWGMILAAWAAVVLRFPATLTSGYFRYDDFDLLSVARGGNFWTTLWQPHGDHVMPLTRLLATLGSFLFGTTPWPYNLGVWCCMGLVLMTGILLLAELHASRPAQLCFIVVVVFWSPWAEIMSGYYILSSYLLIAALGFGAVSSYLRWRRRGRGIDLLSTAACVLLAPLVDLSGSYVPGALLVFLGADLACSVPQGGLRAWLTHHRLLLAGCGLAGAIGLGTIIGAYALGDSGVFLGMSAHGGISAAKAAGDLGYLLSAGTLSSLVIPFIYARLPSVLLWSVVGATVAAWLAFTFFALLRAEKSRRWSMAAAFGVVLGAGLMVVLGRPSAETTVVRWAAKHICPVYLWMGLLLALSWDSLWRAAAGRLRLLWAESTLIAAIGFILLQGAFGLLGMAVSFPPFGYAAEIRDAGRRRAALAQLREQVIGPLAGGTGPMVAPILDGNYLQSMHPSLFDYNLSDYFPFLPALEGRIEFVRTPAMQPQSPSNAPVRTVPELRHAVSDSFRQRLAASPGLQAYYFREVPLRTAPVPGGAAKSDAPFNLKVNGGRVTAAADGGALIESDGHTEISIRENPWDPEAAPRLRLLAHRTDIASGAETPATVVFRPDLLSRDWHGTIALGGDPGSVLEFDLRQAYVFALSTQVDRLRLVLTTPGRYYFRMAEILP